MVDGSGRVRVERTVRAQVGRPSGTTRSQCQRIKTRRWLLNNLVRPAGLEPATCSLEGCCSIHLRYGRAVHSLAGWRDGGWGGAYSAVSVSLAMPAWSKPQKIRLRQMATTVPRAMPRSSTVPSFTAAPLMPLMSTTEVRIRLRGLV